jgi:hypothetical protein
MQEKTECYQEIGTHFARVLLAPLDTGGGTP